MAKNILRLDEKKAVVKLTGSGVSTTETVTLATDLLSTTQSVSGTPKVNILGFMWLGAAAATITITRNGTTIATISDSSGQMDFMTGEFVENINNTSDIVVTIAGTAQIWMTLRKDSGYASKIETPEFSVYDNTNQVGQ